MPRRRSANCSTLDARKRVTEEKARVEGLIHNLKDELGDGPENDELSELSDYDQHPADTASETSCSGIVPNATKRSGCCATISARRSFTWRASSCPIPGSVQ